MGVMPSYHPISDYKGHSITVTPVGWRWFFRKAFYFVGDKVILDITFKAVSPKAEENPLGDYVIWEYHPNDYQKQRYGLREDPKLNNENYGYRFTSLPIMQQGVVSVYVGSDYGGDPKAPLFDTSVFHKDVTLRDVFLVLLGGIVGGLSSFAVGIVLGFIDIEPFRRIWIP